MNDKFSIIIPTMWLSDLIHRMLPIYDRSEFVGEIIIIDNDTTKTPTLSQYKKIQYFTKGENIFVNPAWNWGVKLAQFRIILANDDIWIDDVDDIFITILSSDFDIIGTYIAIDDTGKRIEDVTNLRKFPANNYGCFMYVKNYTPIPDELKIWYGDSLQFRTNPKKGRFKNFGIHTNQSTTINSDSGYFRSVIGGNDIKIVRGMYERSEYLGKILII
jgi:hypothetical protein